MRLFILLFLSTLFLTACTDAKKSPITPLERIDTPAVVIDVPLSSGASVVSGAIVDQKHAPIPPPGAELSPVVSEAPKAVQSVSSASATPSPLPPPELPPLPDMQ